MFDRKEYITPYMKEYRITHIDSIRASERSRYSNARRNALEILGGICAECNESEIEFLTIDHVNNDGNLEVKHHKQIFFDIIKGRSDNSRFQVLCRNCNSGKLNELIHNKLPESSHSFNGDPCKRCNNTKITRTSFDAVYGIRNRSECLFCKKQEGIDLKISVISSLGGKCNCCSQSEMRKLTIDHVSNNGMDLRRTDRCGTTYFYRKFLDGSLDTSFYQVLCWNCNFSKFLGDGLCVHLRKEV